MFTFNSFNTPLQAVNTVVSRCCWFVHSRERIENKRILGWFVLAKAGFSMRGQHMKLQ